MIDRNVPFQGPMASFHTVAHVVLTSLLAIVAHEYWQLASNYDHPAECNHQHSEAANADSSALPKPRQRSTLGYHGRTGDSSVWCWGSNHTDRVCRFRNLCYLPSADEFLFLHGPNSAYVGLPSTRYEPALLDLSSVADHNTQYFNFMDAVGSEVRRSFSVDRTTIVNGTSLILRRFHPINIMHVLHDDLLPLYDTLLMLSDSVIEDVDVTSSRFVHQLIFADASSPGPFEELYKVFTVKEPIYKDELRSMNSLVCFAEAYVGVFKHSTWYQYGFTVPQGPIQGHRATARTIRRFCRHVKDQLSVDANSELADGRTVVLISRKYNRLILNEADLILALARGLRMKVISVGLETHSLSEIISAVSTASVMIGMHGSLLSLAMFLPRGALLVELFPYAINPSHYTPYRTLAGLPGMEIDYEAWRNTDAGKTVPHPDRSREEGGIFHLTADQQAAIMASREVPRHLCCSDPEWLYRIYQDTVVDVEAIVQLITDVRIASKRSGSLNEDITIERELFPSFVTNVTCHSDQRHTLPSLFISWKPPANIEYVNGRDVKYEVWIQEEGSEDYSAWMLTKFEHSFTAGIQPATNYAIWVRCLIDDTVGPFNTLPVICST